jgi:hypothetical protein
MKVGRHRRGVVVAVPGCQGQGSMVPCCRCRCPTGGGGPRSEGGSTAGRRRGDRGIGAVVMVALAQWARLPPSLFSPWRQQCRRPAQRRSHKGTVAGGRQAAGYPVRIVVVPATQGGGGGGAEHSALSLPGSRSRSVRRWFPCRRHRHWGLGWGGGARGSGCRARRQRRKWQWPR